MPKRLLDDSLLTSPSLAKCSPRAQDAFPRFILLADDFGCFDLVPRVLFAKGWPYRPDVSEEDVASWLGEFEALGMLYTWEEGGRMYGYLTGWHGEHGQKARDEYDSKTARHGSKRRTPRPPGWLPDVSRFVPARETSGAMATFKKANDSVPARETGVSRSVPATVVPVAVAVAGVVPADAVAPAPHPKAKKREPEASDPRHAAFIAAAHKLYGELVPGGRLTVNGKDGTHLRDFLACQPTVTAEEFGRVYAAAVRLGGKWPGCTRVADVVDRWTDLLPLARGGQGEAQRAIANRGIRPADSHWWDRLTPEQRTALARERHKLAPELDAAPLNVAGEVGHERPEVVKLLERWRSIAEGVAA